MFGCCVAGRLLQTNLQKVDETHAYFELPAATTINHVCVFLLGTVPFPEGYGATVHFFWPGRGFQLLGLLSNEKPSAIFRLRGNFNAEATTSSQDRFSMPTDDATTDSESVTAILGLSVEPIDQITPQLSALQPSSTSTSTVLVGVRNADPTIMAERIVKHLFNFIGGFVEGDNEMASMANVAIPINIIQRWYESFLAKIRAGGAGFLERVDE